MNYQEWLSEVCSELEINGINIIQEDLSANAVRRMYEEGLPTYEAADEISEDPNLLI